MTRTGSNTEILGESGIKLASRRIKLKMPLSLAVIHGMQQTRVDDVRRLLLYLKGSAS
jgi:hypothetical protein